MLAGRDDDLVRNSWRGVGGRHLIYMGLRAAAGVAGRRRGVDGLLMSGQKIVGSTVTVKRTR